MTNIFDTHAHYSLKQFNSDRDEILAELPNHGVKYVMVASTDVADAIKNDRLTLKYDYIYGAAGIHPSDCGEVRSGYLEQIEKIINENPKMLAVGEIGLDYHYDGYDRDLQMRFFRQQLELAKKLDLPAILHCRDATEDMLKILREYRPKGVMHCFSGSVETAREVLELGLYIGITGVVTFSNARKVAEVVERVPIDRLLIETDCPYMAPHPFRGKRCDSSMLTYSIEKIAEIKNLPPQEIADATCENGVRLFGLE